jgi:hypothetical protein
MFMEQQNKSILNPKVKMGMEGGNFSGSSGGGVAVH